MILFYHRIFFFHNIWPNFNVFGANGNNKLLISWIGCVGTNSDWGSFWAAEMYKRGFDRGRRPEEATNLWPEQAWGEKGE